MAATQPLDRSASPAAHGTTVCTACPMLCDDVSIGPGSIERACEHGRRAIAAVLERHAGTGRPEATIDGVPAGRADAMLAAVGLLADARRVLVTGLAAATLSAQRLAAILAERLGGGFDTGSRDGRLLTGPSIARAGEVTAQWEELRDRADLVVLWFADPAASHPRFVERFLAAHVAGRPRTILSIGPVRPSLPDELQGEYLRSEVSGQVDLARGIEAEDAGDPRVSRILSAVGSAGCTAIVTAAGDSIGLERWAVARFVRKLAHARPAFEIPLGPGILAGGGNAAGAAAVAVWRHGAAGAIAEASDLGGSFFPAEADGERLVERGEVDCVVVVGGLSESMQRAVSDATTSQSVRGSDVVWIGAEPQSVVPGARRTVFIRSAGTLLESEGRMLREDGRLVTLRPLVAADVPPLEDVLGRLIEELEADARHREPRP